jgi:hypothetical protein
MAIVTMTDAVADTVASSAEYNKVTANIRDLDARLGAVVSTSTAHARLTALEAITADTATAPGGIGNQQLANRLGSGIGTSGSVTTGTATAQLTDVRTRLGVLENADACYAYQATDQQVSNPSVIALDSELFDTNTMHVTTAGSNTRITCKKAGIYSVGGFLGLVGGGLQASRRVAWIAKNGTVIPGLINSVPPSLNTAWITAVPLPTAPVQLAVNDYLELFGYWGAEDTTITGTNRRTAVSSGYNPALFAVYLRP